MRRRESLQKRDKQYYAAGKLYGEHAADFLKSYRKRKRILVISILAGSVILVVFAMIREMRNPKLVDGRYIVRDEKGGSEKNVAVEARSENGFSKVMQIRVEQQLFTEEELAGLWPDFEQAVKQSIFAADDSADYVSKDLNLPASIPGYPFLIKWKSEQPLIVSGSGRINEERLSETQQKQKGAVVVLTAVCSCQDFSKEISIPVRVFGKHLTKEEVFWQQAEAAVSEWSERSAYGTVQQLPESVEEERMTYREQGGKEWLVLLLCGLTAAILVVRKMDEDLKSQVKKRDEQLEWEYPLLVNRFVLYYGAGLTIKNIWQRICRDYEERKNMTGINCAYEEMLKADRKMQDGLGEREAYSAFAHAIGLTKYRSLISLLQQTLQTGGGDIKEQLNEQLTEAFLEQKRNARILGEKAGTRMLLPMFLMLAVVLVIILIPAFLSF